MSDWCRCKERLVQQLELKGLQVDPSLDVTDWLSMCLKTQASTGDLHAIIECVIATMKKTESCSANGKARIESPRKYQSSSSDEGSSTDHVMSKYAVSKRVNSPNPLFQRRVASKRHRVYRKSTGLKRISSSIIVDHSTVAGHPSGVLSGVSSKKPKTRVQQVQGVENDVLQELRARFEEVDQESLCTEVVATLEGRAGSEHTDVRRALSLLTPREQRVLQQEYKSYTSSLPKDITPLPIYVFAEQMRNTIELGVREL